MTEWDLDVYIPGRPAPQGSKRYLGPKRMVEMSKYVAAWRANVRAGCAATWNGRAPLDGPIELDVEFVRARPKSAPKSRTPDATTTPDLSKLIRSTEDAVTSAGVWADDARVTRLTASKRCAEIGETPGARIRIRALPTAKERAAARVRSATPRAPNPGTAPPKRANGEAVIKNPIQTHPSPPYGPQIHAPHRAITVSDPARQPTQTAKGDI